MAGRVLPIREMSDDHLTAAIKMIERGYNFLGNNVSDKVKSKLPALKTEVERRFTYNVEEIKATMPKQKIKKREYDLVDIRFEQNPSQVYTYSVRKGAKVKLGDALVVTNDQGTRVVFVVGINTNRGTGSHVIKEIKQKVVKL